MDPLPRAVLRDGVTRDDIDDVAQRLGWQLTNVVEPADGRPPQLIFAAKERHTFMYLIEEQRFGVLYAQTTGLAADVMLASLLEALPCYDIAAADDLLAPLASPVLDEPGLHSAYRGIAVMMLLGSRAQAATIERFEKVVEHVDPRVRLAALAGATYTPWPALRPVVQRIANDDPDVTLRASAAELLKALPEEEA